MPEILSTTICGSDAVSKRLSPTRSRLALHQLQGGGDAGVDLARAVERVDPRAVEQEDVAALRLPLRDGLLELRIDLRCVFVLVLQRQDAAELSAERVSVAASS